MAKRKRLTPARAGFVAPEAAAPVARPPIAQVASEAAALSALDEMRSTWDSARAEGRLVTSLPLEAVVADHLVRDRAGLDDEAMGALTQSLQARGQQTPIEVLDLGEGRYGLISGWRRLTALRALHDRLGEDRFARVDALIRRPEDQQAAYVAMVEENEIRSDLSLYERARIVVKARAAGVFDSDKAALQTLFAAVSYAKRSKIKSLMPVVVALDGALRFPEAVTERQGLALARALETLPELTSGLRAALEAADPSDAASEAAALAEAVARAQASPEGPAAASPGGAVPEPVSSASVPPGPVPEPRGASRSEAAPGKVQLRAGAYRVELTGLGVTPDFVTDLQAWLAQRGAGSDDTP